MPKTLAAIYDEFAATYHQNRGRFDLTSVLEAFHGRLGARPGRLLDLGCGAGEPVARYFLDRGWQVTGVDFSQAMLALAAQYAPAMQPIQADMRSVALPAQAFDAIVAAYSLFHLPSADHQALFDRMAGWLRPGGKVLFTYATADYTGAPAFDGTREFMGQLLWYGHKTVPELCADLAAAGFAVLELRDRDIGGETFLWVTATRG